MSAEFRGQANRLFAKNCLLCLKIQVQSILDLMQSWKTSVYPILEKRSTMRKKHSKDGSFLQGSPVMNYLRRAIENKYLIIFDHSSALSQHIDLFNLLLSEGYEVHFNFIFIPEEEAQEASEKQETLYTSILY